MLLSIRKRSLAIAGVCIFLLSGHPAFAQRKAVKKEHILAPAIRLAKKSMKTLESVTDFQATFHKMEVVRNKRVPHIMLMKLRHKPFSVYLKFLDPHAGREVIFVDGQNNGNILAHETGFKSIAGTISVNPTSRRAMKEGKFPITEIGIVKMLQGVIDVWEKEKKIDGGKLNYYPNATIESTHQNLKTLECVVVETIRSRKKPGVQFHITRLYIDKKTNLPVRVEHYGFPRRAGGEPPLLAQYTYWNVKTNVKLQDIDFDTNNPNYGF